MPVFQPPITRTLRLLIRSAKREFDHYLSRGYRVDPRRRLFSRLLLHIARIRPIQRITSTALPREGAGSQAVMIAAAMGFARASGLEYVHTPFERIEHADRPMSEWVLAWETLFNLGDGEMLAIPGDAQTVDFAWNWRDLLCLLEVDCLPDLLSPVIPELREKFVGTKAPQVSSKLCVRVHVRRGDVNATGHPMWTDLAYYDEIISEVSAVLEQCVTNHRVEVFSHGATADFAEAFGCETEFFVDHDPIWTFERLTQADVLIMAKSLFSFYAALICPGVVIYQPYAMPPVEGWLVKEPGKALHREVFLDRLSRSATRGI